jgi:hypothetical protein
MRPTMMSGTDRYRALEQRASARSQERPGRTLREVLTQWGAAGGSPLWTDQDKASLHAMYRHRADFEEAVYRRQREVGGELDRDEMVALWEATRPNAGAA